MLSCIVLAGQIFLISDERVFALPENGSYGFSEHPRGGTEYTTHWTSGQIPEADFDEVKAALMACEKVGD